MIKFKLNKIPWGIFLLVLLLIQLGGVGAKKQTNPIITAKEIESILDDFTDETQTENEITDLIMETWDPQDVSFLSNSMEGLNYQEMVENILLDDYTLDFNDEEDTNGYSIDHSTMGKPEITIMGSNSSGFQDITIPIRSKLEDGFEPEMLSAEEEIIIGYRWKIDLDKSITKHIRTEHPKLKFMVTGKFLVKFNFCFPVILKVQYPKEVIQGTTHTLNCTLIPYDDPTFHEFEVKVDIENLNLWFLATFLFPQPPLTQLVKKSFKIKDWWKWVTGYVWVEESIPQPPKWEWFVLASVNAIFYDYHEFNDYTTPIGEGEARIDIPGSIDISYLIRDKGGIYTLILDEICSFGIGFGYITLDKSIITASLTVDGGPEKPIIWTEANETRSIDFRVNTSTNQLLSLDIDDFVLNVHRIRSVPNLWFHFDDLKIPNPVTGSKPYIRIPFSEWLPSWEFDLPGFTYYNPDAPIQIGSNDSFSIPGVSYESSDVYDFSMQVSETSRSSFDVLSNIRPYDQMYDISMWNDYGKSDIIKLDVSELPPGYTYDFVGRTDPYYNIGSYPTSAHLVVSPPEQISVPPGDVDFTISATSLAKEHFQLTDATVTKTASLTVPKLVDFSFDLEQGTSEIIQVQAGEDVLIGYYGRNNGNMNDTIKTNAILNLGDSNYTWKDVHSVDPYGSGSGYYYNGEIGFSFSLEDIYPSPGLYELEIKASNVRSPTISRTKTVYLNFSEAYNAESAIWPNNTVMFADWEINFTLEVKNLGNVPDSFIIASDGWNDYLIIPKNTTTIAPMDIDKVIVTLRISNPDDVPEGTYDFRILLISTRSGETAIFHGSDVSIAVYAPDYVPPGITHLFPRDPSKLVTYPTSSLTHGLAVIAHDEWPHKLEIFIDNSPFTSYNWTSDDLIQVPVTGSNQLMEGLHNITLVFNDTNDNIASTELWVNITATDYISPIIGPSLDLEFPENFKFTQHLHWDCTEEFLWNATIFLNGNPLLLSDDYKVYQRAGEEPLWHIECPIEPGSLTTGVYNFTLFIQDFNNNSASSTILVTITSNDNLIPTFTSPLPSSLGYQSRNENLSIIVTDSYPSHYKLWINSVLEVEGTWQSDQPLIFYSDELPLLIGDNEIELTIFDLANNSNTYPWTYQFRDIDAPTFLSEPSDFTVFEHNLSDTVLPFWQVEDLNPGYYRIYRDGQLVIEDRWGSASNNITIPKSSLTAGKFTFKIEVNDTSGNTDYSSVEVTVNDVIAPYVWPLKSYQFDPFSAPDWFEWLIIEHHLDRFEVYCNDEKVDEGSLKDKLPVVFMRITDYSPEEYNYTLLAYDESGNIGRDTIIVTVTDYAAPYIQAPPHLIFSEGTTGNSLVYEILEANPHSYSLYLDGELEDSGPLETTTLIVSVDGLIMGNHTYILIVQDQQGLSYSCTSYVLVVDTTAPTITRVADCRFVSGDEGAYITWDVFDLHPASLTIKRNGTVIREESWTEDEITLYIVGWAIGAHNIELEVMDTSGNVASDEVLVIIVGEESVSEPIKVSASGFEYILVLFVITILSSMKILKRKKRI
ncbi:MAG: hypothetical protein ACFFB5_13365 [Promethearchaeota archaeon]